MKKSTTSLEIFQLCLLDSELSSQQITPKFAKNIPLSVFPFFLFLRIKFAVEYICLVLSFHSVSELETCGNFPNKWELILLKF